MENELKFTDNFEVRIKFNLNCYEGYIYGSLRFRKNKLPILKLDSLSTNYTGPIKLSAHEQEIIHCQSDKYSYSLIENKAMIDRIWPRYIIQGEFDGHSAGIEVFISGVSEWIDQQTHFKITETEIKKDRHTNNFDEIVHIDSKKYRIKSKYSCKIENVEKRDFIVSECTTISLISLDKKISAYEAENFSYDIRRFFSLLLAVPLSFECVWLVNSNGIDRKLFYFSSSTLNNKPFEYPIECLIHPSIIFNEIRWEKLFKNYFSSPKRLTFKNIWGRLVSLFSYTGIWDYELLGYVSVLDSYCDNYSNKKGRKLTKSDYKRLKEKLFFTIDRFSQNLGEEYVDVISSFKNSISEIKNSNLPIFKKKFDLMMKDVDPNILKILNFTDEEFAIIKKIRNAAAHGQPLKTRYDNDISYENKLKDKLLILEMYLVYRDFGVTPVQFARSIRRSHIKFVLNAEINKVEIDKLIGDIPFWPVDQNSFDAFKACNSIYVGVEYYRLINKYKFSKSLTQECQKWLFEKQKKQKYIIDHIRETIVNSEIVDVEYVSRAYIVYKYENIELHGVCKVIYA